MVDQPQVLHLLDQLVLMLLLLTLWMVHLRLLIHTLILRLLVTQIVVGKLMLAIELVLLVVRIVRMAICSLLLFGCLEECRVVMYNLIIILISIFFNSLD